MVRSYSKPFLSLLNVLLIIVGFTSIVLCVRSYLKYKLIHLILVMTSISVFILFIGILGFIGAVRHSKCVTLLLYAVAYLFFFKRHQLIDTTINYYEDFVTNPTFLGNDEYIQMIRKSFIKMKCCGFKERNQPESIFDTIDFCRNIHMSKPLCDEKMKNDLHRNLVTVIIIYAILTGLSTLACMMAVYLSCFTSNQI